MPSVNFMFFCFLVHSLAL